MAPSGNSKMKEKKTKKKDRQLRLPSANGTTPSTNVPAKDIYDGLPPREIDEKSPSSPLESPNLGSRHRIGSSYSIGSSPFLGNTTTITAGAGLVDDNAINLSRKSPSPRIGAAFPRIDQATIERRQQGSANPSRTGSPLVNRPPKEIPARRVVSISNGKKILELISQKNGRMQGHLRFSKGSNGQYLSAMCFIDHERGSLMTKSPEHTRASNTIVPDLRGCKVQVVIPPEENVTCIRLVTRSSGIQVLLRPSPGEEFDQWLAAFLAWTPLLSKGSHNKSMTLQPPLVERRPSDEPHSSDIPLFKDKIVKTGRLLYVDQPILHFSSTSRANSPTKDRRRRGSVPSPWREVSCTLKPNGVFRISAETGPETLAIVDLSRLSRSAVQSLDVSVFQEDYCIAIYPDRIASSNRISSARPIYLSVGSRVVYEVWLVLLRAFTTSGLYGPPENSAGLYNNVSNGMAKPHLAASKAEMFRIERSLSVRITEAKLKRSRPQTSPEYSSLVSDYFCEVLVDEEVRARTTIKQNTSNPFWREEYQILDLAPVVSDFSILLHRRKERRKDFRRGIGLVGNGDAPLTSAPAEYPTFPITDELYGRIEPPADLIDVVNKSQEMEGWWAIIDRDEEKIGDALVQVKVEEQVVLMAGDYQPLSDLLHQFSTGLTVQISRAVSSELRQLSDMFLNIFQSSGEVDRWFKSLIEDEIDGDQRPTRSKQKFNLGRRGGSNDSYDSSSERELVIRKFHKSATVEASLLFRGNTLLTKSLDLHMKRLGKEYLFETLAGPLSEIESSELSCEVDPNKIDFNQEDLETNWDNLIAVTESVWEAIVSSASKCPAELGELFRHIRSCAEERYGDLLRSASYSSVSAFLFLRFFCPAVLNPKLFGLLKHHPQPKSQRTLTLVAKSLQGLANMTTFGNKEGWMSPMNHFLTERRYEFKEFIDHVCTIASPSPNLEMRPIYVIPNSVYNRLPPLSREGFPTLPYLIDQPRNFASLVELWLSSPAAKKSAELDGDLFIFHHICVGLQQRVAGCLDRAEKASIPTLDLLPHWKEAVEELENPPADNSYTNSNIFSEEPTRTPSIQKDNDSYAEAAEAAEGHTGLDSDIGGGTSIYSSRTSRDGKPPTTPGSGGKEGTKNKLSNLIGEFRRKTKMNSTGWLEPAEHLERRKRKDDKDDKRDERQDGLEDQAFREENYPRR